MRPLSCAALAAAALFAAPAYAPGVYSYRTGVRGEAILGRRQLALNATNATAADPTTVGEFCFLNRFRGCACTPHAASPPTLVTVQSLVCAVCARRQGSVCLFSTPGVN
jgi:hypothetical protein